MGAQMSHLPYYGEDEAHVESVEYFEDVLNQDDTISIEELEADEQSEMSRAGLDDLTPVDTFLNLNGESRFITEI